VLREIAPQVRQVCDSVTEKKYAQRVSFLYDLSFDFLPPILCGIAT
jgi:hypothetical protein